MAEAIMPVFESGFGFGGGEEGLEGGWGDWPLVQIILGFALEQQDTRV